MRLVASDIRVTQQAVLTSLLLLTACTGPVDTPEAAVREWLAVAEQAAIEQDRRGLNGLISESYADARGNAKSDIDAALRLIFLRYNDVKLIVSVDAIEMFADTAADVDVTVGMAGSGGGVLGFSADAYRFALELQVEDGDWYLTSAMWAAVGDELH